MLKQYTMLQHILKIRCTHKNMYKDNIELFLSLSYSPLYLLYRRIVHCKEVKEHQPEGSMKTLTSIPVIECNNDNSRVSIIVKKTSEFKNTVYPESLRRLCTTIDVPRTGAVQKQSLAWKFQAPLVEAKQVGSTSASFLAEISVSSPQKIFIFII